MGPLGTTIKHYDSIYMLKRAHIRTSYQKVQKCIVLCVSQASSLGGGVDITPRTKASVDEVGAGGAGAGGGTEAIAGADEVALVSDTGTAADL